MKKGWEYKKLKEVGRTQTGTTPSKSIKSYFGGEIPFIRPAELNIDGNGTIEYNSELKLTSEGALKSRTIKANSTLMCCIGSVGKTGYTTKDVTCNQQINTITPYEDYNCRFVYYALLTPLFQNEVIKIANSAKATLPIISKGKWEEMSIPVPPLSEQQSIVDYLDSAFAKIDAMKANAEKALNEAKALFQASLKEMLEPQKEWEEKKFGKICDFVRGPFGGSLKKECFKDSGYVVYEQQNAIYNKFTFRYFINEEKYNSLIRFKVNSGDLIMSCSGTIGKVAIIPENFKEGIINQALLKLTPNKDVDAHFLKYLMESNYFKEIINANIEGVAIKNIASVAVLKEIKLYVPKVSEQQKIVIEIDSLKSKVDRLQENYEKISQECDALKQAILRQVFE